MLLLWLVSLCMSRWVSLTWRHMKFMGELQSCNRFVTSALVRSALVISPALFLKIWPLTRSWHVIPTYILGKTCLREHLRASRAGPESQAHHSMCVFLAMISCTSLYFSYRLDKTFPTLFCAFTSHVIAATSEMKKSPSNWLLCAELCVLLSPLLISYYGCLFGDRCFPNLPGLALLKRAHSHLLPQTHMCSRQHRQ